MKEEQSTELRILEAAERLFLAQGFMKTTTSQIAKEADCNQALVHYYYRTKEQLFERIYGDKIQLITQKIINRKTETATFEEQIRGMVETHFDFLRQNPLLVNFLLRESLNGSTIPFNLLRDKIISNLQPVLIQLERELNEEIAKGNIRPISITDLILTIGSMDVLPFVVTPIIRNVFGMSETEINEILEHRKEEAINTVLARLRK